MTGDLAAGHWSLTPEEAFQCSSETHYDTHRRANSQDTNVKFEKISYANNSIFQSCTCDAAGAISPGFI